MKQDAVERQVLLDGLRCVEGIAQGHLFKGIGRPSLHHEQQVKGSASLGRIGGEIVLWAVYVAADFGAQQQACGRAAVVGSCELAVRGAHGQGKVRRDGPTGRVVHGYVEHDRCKGFVGGCVLPHLHIQLPHGGIPPHGAAGQGASCGRDERQLVHTAVQGRQRQLHFDGGTGQMERVEVADGSAAGGHQSQQAVRAQCLAIAGYPYVYGLRCRLHRQHVLRPLGRFGQGEALAAPLHIGIARLGRQGEESHVGVEGGDEAEPYAVGVAEGDGVQLIGDTAAFQLKGDALLDALYPAAALGKEVYAIAGRTVGAHQPRCAERGDRVGSRACYLQVFGVDFVRCNRLFAVAGAAEHGHYARIAGFASPVHHFAGVGAHFVEAALDRQLQGKTALRPSQRVRVQGELFHQASAGIEQVHVEHAAQR